jgi:cystathionine beta-synthase
VLDQTVSDVMDQPFPVVESDQPVESVAKLLSKSNRAVLMKKDGVVQGIVTRFDVLEHLMRR